MTPLPPMPPRLRQFFSDRNGRIVIAQWPNAPLVAWAVLAVASRAADGEWAGFFAFFSAAALVTWASLEVLQGDSPFRRVLGLTVLAAMVWTRLP